MNHLKSPFAICCLVAALAAGCGSSSYSPSSGGPGSINGTFADAPVVGLSYSCGSYSAVTGAGGAFSCPSGSSTVTFKVGGITICAAPPQAMMTPVSCAQATDPTANASTPSVVAVARFLLSINTTPGSTVTITPAELQAAANQTLSFSNPTPTDAELFFAVRTINPGAMLVSIPTAQIELTSTVLGALAGSYAGSFSGSSSGTWSAMIAAGGGVSGSATDSMNHSVIVSGMLTSGTTYGGSAGSSSSWTGSLDTSKSPVVFSGTWSGGGMAKGIFEGTKQ